MAAKGPTPNSLQVEFFNRIVKYLLVCALAVPYLIYWYVDGNVIRFDLEWMHFYYSNRPENTLYGIGFITAEKTYQGVVLWQDFPNYASLIMYIVVIFFVIFDVVIKFALLRRSSPQDRILHIAYNLNFYVWTYSGLFALGFYIFTATSTVHVFPLLGVVGGFIVVTHKIIYRKRNKQDVGPAVPGKDNSTAGYVNTKNKQLVMDDQRLLDKFRDMLKITNRIKMAQVSEYLQIGKKDLIPKLVAWGKFLPFKIDEDLIVVDDLKAFQDALDQQFKDWQNGESSKDRKKN